MLSYPCVFAVNYYTFEKHETSTRRSLKGRNHTAIRALAFKWMRILSFVRVWCFLQARL
jgi:hypothetical protein